MAPGHHLRPAAVAVALAALACSGRVVEGTGAGTSEGTAGSTGASTSTTTTASQPSAETVTTSATPDPSTGTVGDGDGSSTSADDGPDGRSGSECDLWAQDCKVGFRCVGWANDGGDSWNATRCVPIARPAVAAGEPCTVADWIASGVDDCEPGTMCWYIDPATLQGTCVPMCAGSEANPLCSGACTTCNITNDGVLLLCLPTCDPIAPSCADGERCLGYSSPYAASLACHAAPPGTAAIGEACHDPEDCGDGLLCVRDDEVPGCRSTSGCCTSYCDRLAEDPCDALVAGTHCEPFFPSDSAPAGCGVEELGVCRRTMR